MIIISVTKGSRKEEGIINDICMREEKISSSQVNIDKVRIWRKNYNFQVEKFAVCVLGNDNYLSLALPILVTPFLTK